MSDNKMRRFCRFSRRGPVAGASPFRVLAVLLAAAPGMAGCDTGTPEGRPAVAIAEVAGEPVWLSELEAMMRAHAAGLGEGLSDAVKSRLLDQLIDRRLLLAEAHRRGIEVADAELDASLRLDGQPAAEEEYREELRRSLTVDKLLRQVIEESGEVSAADEEHYFEEHPELFDRPEVVVLRQILLDDPDRAEAVRDELAGEPERFAEVARALSQSPDHGAPQAFPLDDLPREAIEAVRLLDVGAISDVVEMPPNYLIFQLEERRPEHRISLDEARGSIRARLQEARGSGVVSRLLEDLRARMGVKMHPGDLPFRYVEEKPA